MLKNTIQIGTINARNRFLQLSLLADKHHSVLCSLTVISCALYDVENMTSLLSSVLTECRYFKYQRNEFIDSKYQDLPHYAICPQGKWKTDCNAQRVAQCNLQNKWRWRYSGYDQPVPKGQSEGEPTKQDLITLHLEDSILQVNTNGWKYDNRRYRRPY